MARMRTLDWRRRKTAPCLNDIFQAERRGKQQGRPYERVLVTRAQMDHISELTRLQVWAPSPKPEQFDTLFFGNKFRVEVR